MKDLQTILFGVSLREVVGTTQLQVIDIQIDSRKVIKSSVFVAIKGVQADGHQFINTAIEKGASVIVCEQLPVHLKVKLLI
jgi:UDP-N-acetylmuramoyl-L-alanyl-D-glutamate--2,6-diaminopimelate ligase